VSEHYFRLLAHVSAWDRRGIAHIVNGFNYRQAATRAEKRSFVAMPRIVQRPGDDALAGLRPNQRHWINEPVWPKRRQEVADLRVSLDRKPENHVRRRLAQPIHVVPQCLAKPIEHLGPVVVVPVG
jgi:hypothetical protein